MAGPLYGCILTHPVPRSKVPGGGTRRKEREAMDELGKRYTPEEVARRYHRTVQTVTRWVRSGRLTAINLGGGRQGPYVFRPEDLEDFERQSEVRNSPGGGGAI